MREILFRGKRMDNGEWVEGFYCQFHNRPITNEENSHQIFVAMENAVPFGSMIGGLWYEVIPETVGQYTGLKDNNGKMIFEGDIIKADTHFDREVIYKIIWRNEYSCYQAERFDGIEEFINALSRYEVIGNIFDNPELLEVAE